MLGITSPERCSLVHRTGRVSSRLMQRSAHYGNLGKRQRRHKYGPARVAGRDFATPLQEDGCGVQ